jgi:23S rRNA (guanosine2251-2'-O)-methyltransferase
MNVLQLRNPHSILAALNARSEQVAALHVSMPVSEPAWREVVRHAAERGVRVLPPADRQRGGRTSDPERRAGAGSAEVTPREDVPLDELFRAPADGQLWLALDHLHDPHNVGAIFRTAAFFGVRGIVLTKDRSAPLSATVYDVASGGLEVVPFSLQTNLVRALQQAKRAGLWVLGTSEHASRDVGEIPRDRPWLLVLGNEQKGLRQLSEKMCDDVCCLTPRGPVTSLNVSVAAGILMAALSRGPS